MNDIRSSDVKLKVDGDVEFMLPGSTHKEIKNKYYLDKQLIPEDAINLEFNLPEYYVKLFFKNYNKIQGSATHIEIEYNLPTGVECTISALDINGDPSKPLGSMYITLTGSGNETMYPNSKFLSGRFYNNSVYVYLPEGYDNIIVSRLYDEK